MRYAQRQLKRAADRSDAADQVAWFLGRHGAARREIAAAMNRAGWNVGDGITWRKDAACTVTVTWGANGTAKFNLEPATPGSGRTHFGRVQRHGFKHRLFVKCPDCGDWIQTGRFHQHAGSAKCQATAAVRK